MLANLTLMRVGEHQPQFSPDQEFMFPPRKWTLKSGFLEEFDQIPPFDGAKGRQGYAPAGSR